MLQLQDLVLVPLGTITSSNTLEYSLQVVRPVALRISTRLRVFDASLAYAPMDRVASLAELLRSMSTSLVFAAENSLISVSLVQSRLVIPALSMFSLVSFGSAGRMRVSRVVAPTLASRSASFLLRSSEAIFVP